MPAQSKSSRAKEVAMRVKPVVIKGAKKALTSKTGQKVLKQIVRKAKTKMKDYVKAKCPSCKTAFDKVKDQPLVKKMANEAKRKLKEKCPSCGDALEFIENA